MATSLQISKFSNALANSRTVNDDMDDQARQTWYQIKWENLLVPAPTAISIFGRLTLVAIAADFELIKPEKPWKYIRHSQFQAVITQLRSTGTNAFSKSFQNLDAMQKRSATLTKNIGEILCLVLEYDMEHMTLQERNKKILDYFPPYLDSVEKDCQLCLDKVTQTAKDFEALLHLSQEIYEATTATHGDAKKKEKEIDMLRDVLAVREKNAEAQKKLAEDYLKDMKKYSDKADENFNNALKSMPTGMEIVAMQFGEKMTDLAVQGANVYMQKNMDLHRLGAATATQLVTKGVDAGLAQIGKDDKQPSGTSGVTTQQPAPGPPAEVIDWNDPVFMNAALIGDAIMHLKHVVTSGKGGTVSWDDVVATEGRVTSLGYAIKELESLSADNSKYGKFKLAREAKEISSSALEIGQDLKKLANDRDSDRVERIISEVKELALRAEKLTAAVAIKTGQTALTQRQVTSAEPPPPQSKNQSIVNMAVSSAQFKVTTAEAQATASRELYAEANKSMLEVSKQLADFTAEMAKLKSDKIEWSRIRTILLQAIEYLSELVDSLVRLADFFAVIKNTVSELMAPAFEKLNQLANISLDNLGGLTFDIYTKKKLAKQAVVAGSFAFVMQQIGKAYTTLYVNHIADGMSLLGKMPAAVEDNVAKAKIEQAADDLQTWCQTAQEGMAAILKKELDEFEKRTKSRQKQLEQLNALLPPVSNQMKAAIEDVKNEHVEREKKEIDAPSPLAVRTRPNMGASAE